MRLYDKYSTRLNNVQKEKVQLAYELAMFVLKDKFWVSKLENVEIDVKVPYRRLGRNYLLGGWYNQAQPYTISLCTQGVKADDDKFNYMDLAQTIIHELGHLIHANFFSNKKFEFSTENKSKYACKNHKEDFAECFVDYIFETDATQRASEMKEILSTIVDIKPRKKVAKKSTKKETQKEVSTKSRVYVVGSQHLTAKGMIEITRQFVENGVEMFEYKNLETGKVTINKKVNLVSNIRKYATRIAS